MIIPKDIQPSRLEEYINNPAPLLELTNTDEAVYVVDLNTLKPIYASRSILHMLGYNEAQIEEFGMGWPRAVTHPDDYLHLSNHIANYKHLPVRGTWHV